jgi:hypothetical protein
MAGRRLARTITLICAAIQLACGEPLAPGDIVGTYALQNVAGEPLPTVLFTNEFATVRVFADTLRFTPDGRGSINTIRENEPRAGDGPTQRYAWQTAFSYRVVEDRIEVAFDCPPNANCVKPPHLVLRETPTGLRADFALGARLPLFYTQVDRGR